MKNIGNGSSLAGIVGVTIILLVGFSVIVLTGFFGIRGYGDFLIYIKSYGDIFVFSLFFAVTGSFAWASIIKNILIKPKLDVLYLLEKENNMCTFIDRSGKQYYTVDNNYSIHEFYSVLKTADVIGEVKNISDKYFSIPRVKESYWLNLYCPLGNIENLWMLPLVYTVLLLGIVLIFMNYNFSFIRGIVLIAFSLYVIIYDAVHKIKKQKVTFDQMSSNAEKAVDLYVSAAALISISLFNIFLFSLFIRAEDNLARVILSIFCLFGLSILGGVMASIFNNDKLSTFFEKMAILILLLYLFGFLVSLC
ncbi:hypothetical protein EOM09_05115 [bacterium]|nr:hypothetical protein [bacterium]